VIDFHDQSLGVRMIGRNIFRGNDKTNGEDKENNKNRDAPYRLFSGSRPMAEPPDVRERRSDDLSLNGHGQRTCGYIDLLLETSEGAVIIDHKSFLGKRADWPAKALSYSGQLAPYRNARHTPAIDSTWIHFAAGGGLVQVE
jgi:hypothetical protein